MKLPFFSHLFSAEKKTLKTPESLLLKRLRSVAVVNDNTLYKNTTVYHHTQSYTIPLMMLDTNYGLYLFEKKEWSYDELKNATIEKAHNQQSSNQTLSYQNTHKIIRQKFNELTHNDGVALHNFLLMENLNNDEYEHLSDDFKQLLPKDRVIFSDSSPQEITAKLTSLTPLHEKFTHDEIMGNLLIQYTIIDDEGKLHCASQEQKTLIDAEIGYKDILRAKVGTGKSSALLLKALLFKLQNKNKNVTIIKPTQLAADLAKQKLLAMVEHAIVEVDLSTIAIVTPKQFTTKDDLVLCDDANLLNPLTLAHICEIQKNKPLLLVNATETPITFNFTERFRKDNRHITFLETSPYAKTLQHINKLLQSNDAKDIVVISNSDTKIKLQEDLEYFIEDKALLLDSSKGLIDQEMNCIILTTYDDIVGLTMKHLIMLDCCEVDDETKLEYAYEMASQSVTLFYNKECPALERLKEIYEDTKE